MTKSQNRITVKNIVSPYGLATVSFLLFFVAWTFPPDLYGSIIHEQDRMFLDPFTFLFYGACAIVFVLGVRGSEILLRKNKPGAAPKQATVNLLLLCIPLLLAEAGCFTYLVKLGAKIDFVGLLSSQQGNVIKQVMHSGQDVGGIWVHTLFFLTGTLWWAAFRSSQRKRAGFSYLLFRNIFYIGIVIDIFTCLACASRGALMPLIIGLFCIHLFTRMLGASVWKILLTIAGSGMFFVTAFLSLSYFRGSSSTQKLTMSLVGYSISSYNRLASILSGSMHFIYAGKGAYLVPFLVENERLYQFFGLRHAGIPDHFTLWQSEFISTALAGLNRSYIWAGVFGYLYSDIGWFALLYMFALGTITGFLWQRFVIGDIYGVTLYPFFAFWILFWIGSNVMFSAYLVDFTVASIALASFERLFMSNAAATGALSGKRIAYKHAA